MARTTRKRLSWVVAVVAIITISSALIITYGGRTNPSVLPDTTTSVSSSSSSQSTATTTASSSSSVMEAAGILSFTVSVPSSGFAAANSFLAFNELFATPGTMMNYTVDIRQIDPAVSHVALSAASTVPGVTVTLSQKEFTFLGASQGITLGVKVDSSVNSSTLPVRITASTAIGVQDASFTFTLEKGLILVAHFTNEAVRPVTAHVNVGEAVRWLDLIAVDDDGFGPVNITFLDGSAASPTLQQYEIWSHTFSQPGTYAYKVDVLGFTSFSATITVS